LINIFINERRKQETYLYLEKKMENNLARIANSTFDEIDAICNPRGSNVGAIIFKG